MEVLDNFEWTLGPPLPSITAGTSTSELGTDGEFMVCGGYVSNTHCYKVVYIVLIVSLISFGHSQIDSVTRTGWERLSDLPYRASGDQSLVTIF